MVQVIDADGHVMDQQYTEEISAYMPSRNARGQIFPALDHMHQFYLTPTSRQPNGAPRVRVGAKEWLNFLDDTEIDWTVIYPSGGLAVGRIASEDWAVAACRAYNNWLHDTFLNVNPRVQGVALIPVQDVEAACTELHRAVEELGVCGAMLPANGEGLKAHLGAKLFWPIYEEAEKLGCSLAVHGGVFNRLGMDTFTTYYPVHALGHPVSVMIQAAAMLSHGVFERFPGLQVAYLEGGAAWVVFFLDRLDRSWHEGHYQVDINGEPVGPRAGEKGSEHFKRHAREGRIFIGFDIDDEGLGAAVQRAGREPFLYASDFPHEGHTAELCRHELDKLLMRDDLTDQDKHALLFENAQRFYPLAVARN